MSIQILTKRSVSELDIINVELGTVVDATHKYAVCSETWGQNCNRRQTERRVSVERKHGVGRTLGDYSYFRKHRRCKWMIESHVSVLCKRFVTSQNK